MQSMHVLAHGVVYTYDIDLGFVVHRVSANWHWCAWVGKLVIPIFMYIRPILY